MYEWGARIHEVCHSELGASPKGNLLLGAPLLAKKKGTAYAVPPV